jgi:hypothetical protein
MVGHMSLTQIPNLSLILLVLVTDSKIITFLIKLILAWLIFFIH